MHGKRGVQKALGGFVLGLSLVLSWSNMRAQDIPAAKPPKQASAEDRRRQGLPQDADITRPVLIHNSFPEFSEEARRAKVSGTVLLKVKLDDQGKPAQVTVIRGIGYGLDEKAVESARRYRFNPAMEDGKPIPWEMDVEINFSIR